MLPNIQARGRAAIRAALALAPAGMLMAALAAPPAAAQVSGYEVKLPASAKAGDLTRFQPCSFKGLPSRGVETAECATLVVAENQARPAGRLIALPVVKLPALKPAPLKSVPLKSAPLEPVFWLEGGPGVSNMKFPVDARTVLENHDVYMLGYRGVDDPAPLQCPEVMEAVTAPNPLSPAAATAIRDASRRCAARFTASGVDLRHFTMVDVIRDHEALRTALGLSRINLIADSFGTRLAQYYTRLHPASVRRSIQLGINPPGHFSYQPAATDAILRDYARRCAADAACSQRTPDLFKTVVGTLARNDLSHDGVPIDMDKVRVGAGLLLFNRSTAVMVFDAAIAAEKGDSSGFARLAGLYDAALPAGFVWGDFAAKAGGEGIGDESAFVAQRRSTPTSFGSPLDLLFWSIAGVWPSEPFPAGFDKAVEDRTETLLINGELDVSTPVQFGRSELLPHLPNGHLVVLKGQGHEDWIHEQTPALDRLLSGFLKDGVVDASAFADAPVKFQ